MNTILSKIEIGAFLKLFNRNGYVLNFSTPDFDAFTADSIGLPLCQTYQTSKGQSLIAYCQNASNEQIIKLFVDLLEYYETNCIDMFGEEKYQRQYEKCKQILNREKESSVKIGTPAITLVNRKYIKDIAERASRDIDIGEYDSAITKARTLLEEVFCHAIETGNHIPYEKGDIGKLYSQVKELYHMHADKDVDRRINTLLSGLEKILSAITEMRNEASDSHGVGKKRIAIKDYHARLFVNSALTMAEFILSVENSSNGIKRQTL